MFVPMPLLVVGGLVVLVLLFLALRGRNRPNDLIGPPSRSVMPRPAPPPKVEYQMLPVGTLSPEADAQARALVHAGEIIQAVKMVREVTGLGLAEAKGIVDEMR